ncbi:MAG: phospholipid N-methyltransferase [Olleya marilimosa]|uniref:Ribosomal RNA adenine dimethylase n=1 Tax=Olleya marilimosa TaxID=272164 RepID=A0ABR8LT41_9FLAO|nr:rRNA adenine N-6-methyltransferase family protein [Olleya marilimosa]MBD3863359.1 ribosomal RNA adenine dimethylase [Olleya marilimosa]MBD3890837.1 ribosomal RNA adenine dimethylase [Olleya marilimosa]
MNKINFLKESLKSLKTSGTLFPSSRFLASKILKGIDFNTAKLIVEFGPGNGVITKEILKQLTPDAKLISFEINDKFYNTLLNINDPRLIVSNQSADRVLEVIKDHGFEAVDYIVSSLPLTNIPKPITKSILKNSYKSLKSKGYFFQYQYSLTYYATLKDTFKGNVNLGFEPLNIPPAFIYTCQKD